MKTSDAIQQVAEELGIPVDVARRAYFSAWEFIKMKMRELPFKEELTEEEFNGYRPNFNIPEIGKLAVTWDKYQKVKRKIEYLRNLKESIQDDSKDKENQGIVQPDSSDQA